VSDTAALTLPALSATAGAAGGVARLPNLTAAAGSAGAALSIPKPTSSAGAAGAGVSTRQLTSTGAGSSGSVGEAEVVAERLTSTGEASAGTVGSAALTLPKLTASATIPDAAALALPKLTASGTALTGQVASAALTLRAPTASATHAVTGVARGTAVLQTLTADGDSAQQALSNGALTLARARVTATALNGGVAIGSAELRELTASGSSATAATATGAVTMYRPWATGLSEPTLAETYRTWVSNTGSGAVTEYTNFSFNSYAPVNGTYYAAGPGGLFQLTGNDDAGTDIAWVVRTGMMDGKSAYLKRLTEVLLAARFDAPVRLRVWTNENDYYDYTINNFTPDVLQQVRATLGRGMRSRYFRVELSGMDGASMELDSMQLPMTPLARRIG